MYMIKLNGKRIFDAFSIWRKIAFSFEPPQQYLLRLLQSVLLRQLGAASFLPFTLSEVVSRTNDEGIACHRFMAPIDFGGDTGGRENCITDLFKKLIFLQGGSGL